jgi:hypothetical protein
MIRLGMLLSQIPIKVRFFRLIVCLYFILLSTTQSLLTEFYGLERGHLEGDHLIATFLSSRYLSIFGR